MKGFILIHDLKGNKVLVNLAHITIVYINSDDITTICLNELNSVLDKNVPDVYKENVYQYSELCTKENLKEVMQLIEDATK